MKMLKTEWAKLEQMDFAEKRQYIWEYYKLHMLGLLAAAFIAGSLLNVWIFNPPKQEYIYFAWIGPLITQQTLDDFAEELDVIVEDTTRYVVRASSYNMDGMDPQMVMALQTRFFAQMQTRSLDVFVLNMYELLEFSAGGFILPIRDFVYLTEEMHPAVYELIMERSVELTFYMDGQDFPTTEQMAVDLTGVAFFEKFGVRTENLFFAIVINGERFERVAKALEVIFDV